MLQYLERRYASKIVRVVGSIFNVVQAVGVQFLDRSGHHVLYRNNRQNVDHIFG